MTFDKRINELGINLPKVSAPAGNYVATKIIGKFLYISGQISTNANGELIKGKVGKELTTEQGYGRKKMWIKYSCSS